MISRPTMTSTTLFEGMNPADFIKLIRATIEQTDGTGPQYFNPIGLDHDNAHFYKKLPQETADKKIGLLILEFAAISIIARQIPIVYDKGAITGGAYALREAIRKNVPSLYRLSEAIGTPRSKKHITEPNTRTNQLIGNYLQKIFQDHGIVAPTAREKSAKQAMQHSAFAGLQFEDVDFMVVWYLLQMHFQQVSTFIADWNATRNTVNESVMETLIEAGLVSTRPKANIRLVDINHQSVSLLDRMGKYAEILKIALAHDIDFREAAQAFCISATLDQWRRTKDPRAAKMNRWLRTPATPNELVRIDALRAEIDPLIKTYAAAYLRPNDLLPEYREAHTAAKTRAIPAIPDEQRAKLEAFASNYFDNIEDKASINMDPAMAAGLQRIPTPAQRRFDLDKGIFDPTHRSRFFHDDQPLYKACSEWEQALLPFALYAMEIVTLPHKNPMVAVVLDDFKRGAHAERYRHKHNLAHIDEALPHAGDLAGKTILDPAQKASKNRVTKIKKSRPGKVVVGPADFQFIFGTIEELRATIPHFAGDGANKTSPAFRQLFKKIFIERNADEVFFPEKWTLSPELVQLRNSARNIQCGFVDRPIDGPVNFHVYTERPGTVPAPSTSPHAWIHQPDTLCNDALSLKEEFQRHALRLTNAPEQGLALARLWARNQLIRPENSPIVSGEVIRPAYAALGVLDFNKKHMDDTLGTPRQKMDGVSHDFHQLWGAGDHATHRLQLTRPQTVVELPDRVDDLLTKFAFLWVVPSSRLQPRPLADDPDPRRDAIELECALMKRFAAAQRSSSTAQEWVKSQRPTSERHIISEGPQS